MKEKWLLKIFNRVFTGLFGVLISFFSSALYVFSIALKLILGLFVLIQSISSEKRINAKLQNNLKTKDPKTKEQELEDFFMAKKFEHRNIESLRLSNARDRFESEIRNVKNLEREKKRKYNRIDGAWKLVSVGTGLFIGGVTFEHMFPIGAIGLGILSGALVGYIGAVINNFLFKNSNQENYKVVPQKEVISAPKIDDVALPQSRSELVQKVLLEAAVHLQKIDEIIPRLKHPESISIVTRLVEIGKRLMDKVAEDPDKLAAAQRIFTYYCAEAVNVADALAKMESESKPDVARILSTQGVLQKLLLLFESTELELKQDDNKSLDIDLKLLDQSLKADLKIG